MKPKARYLFTVINTGLHDKVDGQHRDCVATVIQEAQQRSYKKMAASYRVEDLEGMLWSENPKIWELF